MKIVNDLLRIKMHREQQAETALSQASRALLAAERAVAVAEENLKCAHAEYDAKKHALYEDLFSRLVRRSDLDVTHAKLEKIDAIVKECETKLFAKREMLCLAEKEREGKRVQFRNATRIREKYTELSIQIKDRIAQVQIRKEEMELEEVITGYGQSHPNSIAVHTESAV